MSLVKRLVAAAWLQAFVRAAPFIVVGLLIAALVVERTTIVRVTAQRDRIIRVIDPSGKLSPDKAILAAQRVLTERDAAKTALAVTTRNYRLATVRAQAADLTHARAVEQHDAAIAGKAQHDIEAQLASARADADRHARSLRSGNAATATPNADRGRGGAASVSTLADAPGRAAVVRASTELDDSRICATNTVVAEGWQRWWGEVAAAPR